MRHKGITLVEMLIAMAITLVMMAAVVTVFANVSSSVQRRRASIELASQMRHVRNVLQRDLQGATCPALPWQRTDSNHGYIEIVEGPYSDTHPSMLTDGLPDSDNDGNPGGTVDELDPAVSLVPRYGDGYPVTDPQRAYNGSLVQRADQRDPTSGVVSTLNGLGDYDDILALTVRNEEEPFVGLVPTNVRPNTRAARAYREWGSTTIESPLAEVVWFAVENPQDSANGFFGEPGLRTIYRRVLLIAPWWAPYRYTEPQTGAIVDVHRERSASIRTQPGIVRVLPELINREHQHLALAALISFQEKYDLSVRLEFNSRLGEDGRYLIVANTLADLTKRENRYEHHYYRFNNDTDDSSRIFPYGLISLGGGYSGSREMVEFVSDPELQAPNSVARGQANPVDIPLLDNLGQGLNDVIRSYRVTTIAGANNGYVARPFAYVEGETQSGTPATVRAMLNDDGNVIHLIHGPVPLWGNRRGQDVMLSDALAFDIRVYDPGAPIFGIPDSATDPNSMTVVEPADAAWLDAYRTDRPSNNDLVGDGSVSTVRFLAQGAFVDMGYRLQQYFTQSCIDPEFYPGLGAIDPWFFNGNWTPNRLGSPLAPGYSVYDTWSFHYENNGVNEDDDLDANNLPLIDEGTNGFDDVAAYWNVATQSIDQVARNGPDDVAERETTPPYDRPLRGVMVKLRALERDSQQIHEVSVSQSFVPE